MKRLTLILTACVLSLYGCNSFNHYYPDAPQQTNKQSVVVSGLNEIITDPDIDPQIIKTPPEVFEIVPKGWCPAYRLPTLPPIPKAPLDELNAVKSTDVAAIESMDVRHIVELHNYIVVSQNAINKSYNDYVKQCRNARRVKKTS